MKRRIQAILLALLIAAGCLPGGNEPGALLVVRDTIGRPGREVSIEAVLLKTGPMGYLGQDVVVGEPLIIAVDGEQVAETMTNHLGTARAAFVPKRTGIYRVEARLASDRRYRIDEASGILKVREPGPVSVFMEVQGCLIEGSRIACRCLGREGCRSPEGAAEILGRLEARYDLILLSLEGDRCTPAVRSTLEGTNLGGRPVIALNRRVVDEVKGGDATVALAKRLKSLRGSIDGPAVALTAKASHCDTYREAGVLALGFDAGAGKEAFDLKGARSVDWPGIEEALLALKPLSRQKIESRIKESCAEPDNKEKRDEH